MAKLKSLFVNSFLESSVTVSRLNDHNRSIADGVETEFSFDFLLYDTNNFHLYVDDIEVSTEGYDLVQELDFLGGTVTFNTPPDAGSVVLLQRVMTLDQQTQYPVKGPFQELAHERALDKLTMIAQQIQTKVDQGLLYTPLTGLWATGTLYRLNQICNRPDGKLYLCVVQHTSDDFGTELALGYWEYYTDATSAVQLAMDYAAAAEVSRTIAEEQALIAVEAATRAVGVPIGIITPFIGGFFTNSSNGGFTSILGNSVAGINTLLNDNGWYVCDGSAVNDVLSPIFNAAGRYLPNLTDDRFVMGVAAAGGVGGSSTMSHTHTTQPHTLTIAEMPSHGHSYAARTNDIGLYVNAGTTYGADYRGRTSGAQGGGGAHEHGITGAASSNENRPKFLSCFYVMKVK